MKLLFTKNSHPLSLFLGAGRLIKDNHKIDLEEFIVWSSETIAKEINDYIAPEKLSNENFNKIMAIKSLLVTDAIWDNWEVFLPIIQSLNGLPLTREVLYITDNPLPYLYNAIEIMNMTKKQDFSDEVKRFCATIFLHENVHFSPKPLDFCQIFISQPKFHCKNCEKIGSALPPFNFICPSCSKMFDSTEKDRLFNFKPLIVNEDTTNVELYLEFSPTEIRIRFEELENKLNSSNEVIYLEENKIDVQVGKLLLAKEYVKDELKKLEEELKIYNLT